MSDHPVQFDQFPNSKDFLTSCKLCHAVVDPRHHEGHRDWHDAHNEVHNEIMAQARRYVDPPMYG